MLEGPVVLDLPRDRTVETTATVTAAAWIGIIRQREWLMTSQLRTGRVQVVSLYVQPQFVDRKLRLRSRR